MRARAEFLPGLVLIVIGAAMFTGNRAQHMLTLRGTEVSAMVSGAEKQQTADGRDRYLATCRFVTAGTVYQATFFTLRPEQAREGSSHRVLYIAGDIGSVQLVDRMLPVWMRWAGIVLSLGTGFMGLAVLVTSCLGLGTRPPRRKGR